MVNFNVYRRGTDTIAKLQANCDARVGLKRQALRPVHDDAPLYAVVQSWGFLMKTLNVAKMKQFW